MMMPANFSAVSENEMTYVVGGSIADYLAPAMGAAQWKQFNTNMITLIGNKYLGQFVDSTVGAVFSGSWTPGAGLNKWGSFLSNDGKATWYQIGLNVIGNLAAVYNLGAGAVKNTVGDASIGMTNPAGKKITYVELV